MFIAIEKFIFIFAGFARGLTKGSCEHSYLVGSWADARSWLQKRASEIRTECPMTHTEFNHDKIQVLAFRLPDGYRDFQTEKSLNNLAKFFLGYDKVDPV